MLITDANIITALCLNVELQTLDGELDEKYKKVENLIATEIKFANFFKNQTYVHYMI